MKKQSEFMVIEKGVSYLSFDMLSNSTLFSGFVWIRKLAVSTN